MAGTEGGQAVGIVEGKNSGAMLNATPPLTIDTIDRLVYWYNDGSINSQPLDGGNVQVCNSCLYPVYRFLFFVYLVYR